MSRRFIATAAMLLLLIGCALPPNNALRDWARLASVLVDHPDALGPAASDGLLAQQQALAIYLYALSVLAKEESPLTFRDVAYTPLIARAAADDPAAGEAVAALGQVLTTAHADNLPPHARARSAGSATVIEDLRLRPTIRNADPSVQILVGTLSRGMTGPMTPQQDTYRRLLAAIGEGHALLKADAAVIHQRAVGRAILAEDDRLRRFAVTLEPDAAVGLRPNPAGMVGVVVQP